MAIFKRRDGWVLEKVLPGDTPMHHYQFAVHSLISFGSLEEDNITEMAYNTITFRLVDWYKDSNNQYVKVFYEEA